MAAEIALLIAGLVVLLKGADVLVDGAASMASKFRVSPLMIGLTVVAFGTSMPELGVSMAASVHEQSDIVLGNIMGSNIANILLILGLAAILMPLKVKNQTLWKEIPYGFMAALVLFLMASDSLIAGRISMIDSIDGYVLLLFFSVFMAYVIGAAKSQRRMFRGDGKIKEYSTPVSLGLAIGGIAGVSIGGQWVVSGAVYIARVFGLSEFLIGATIIAVGTSLPELATSAAAALKKRADIAVGNIAGSNIFNIFFVLGISAAVRPVAVSWMRSIDLIFLLLASGLFFVFVFLDRKRELSRGEGIVFLFLFLVYILFTVWRG